MTVKSLISDILKNGLDLSMIDSLAVRRTSSSTFLNKNRQSGKMQLKDMVLGSRDDTMDSVFDDMLLNEEGQDQKFSRIAKH